MKLKAAKRWLLRNAWNIARMNLNKDNVSPSFRRRFREAVRSYWEVEK